MKESYQIVDRAQRREIARLLSKDHAALLPVVRLFLEAKISTDMLVEGLGRSLLELVLEASACEVAGPAHQGKHSNAAIGRHGRQATTIPLADRKVSLQKPRLRRNGGGVGGEVPIPAHEAMRANPRMGAHVLTAMMRGLSTRNYSEVLPEAATSVGVSRSAISRRNIAAGEAKCREFNEKRFDTTPLLVIYMDGIHFGDYCVVAALGIDETGRKHFLGLIEGATENKTVVTDLLQRLVDKGVNPQLPYLFVIDGSKALRSAITAVFGVKSPVQRCRVHKVRNVMDYLPKDERDDAKKKMRAAYRLGAVEGPKRMEQIAREHEKSHPDAAASIREGLEEMFTVDRLGVPVALRRSLVSTNVIESPNAGVRHRTHRIDHWMDGAMVVRWATVAFLETEAKLNHISGHKDLYVLTAALGRTVEQQPLPQTPAEKAG